MAPRLPEYFLDICSCFLDLVFGYALALLGEHLISFLGFGSGHSGYSCRETQSYTFFSS
jgi:hypothetical protein